MGTEQKNKKKTKYQLRKDLLMIKSQDAKAIKKIKEDMSKCAMELLYWSSKTINWYLLNFIYSKPKDKRVYKSFYQWKKDGYSIIKGSKAFCVWSKPLKGNKQNDKTIETKKADNNKETTEEGKEYEFWGLCYLFSDEQVKLSKAS